MRQTKNIKEWMQSLSNKNFCSNWINSFYRDLYDGVFIMVVNTKENLYPYKVRLTDFPRLQNNGYFAIGLLLIDNGNVLVVSYKNSDLIPFASSQQKQTAFAKNDRREAIKQINGREATNAILKSSSESYITNTSDYAAGFCYNYYVAEKENSTIRRNLWYLPSLGELLIISKYAQDLIYGASLIKGANVDFTKAFWSSTEQNKERTWINYITSQRSVSNPSKNTTLLNVLPVTSFEI